jgi:hypothetical protein
MANVQQYALLYATVNGALLTEEASINVTRQTRSQEVNTTAKGYAGESPGAVLMEIDVTSAVPATGIEFDAFSAMVSLTPVNLGILGPGGKVLKVKGFIISDSIQHSVNSESKYDFKFRGTMTAFT